MEIEIRDWGGTVGGIMIGAVFAYLAIANGLGISKFIVDLHEYDIIFSTLIALTIGLYYAMNSFTIVNKEKDLLSLPTFYGFTRSKIKLSEIESWDGQIKRTTQDPADGNSVSKTYILIVYGKFGQKTARYTSYKTRQEVINNLQSVSS